MIVKAPNFAGGTQRQVVSNTRPRPKQLHDPWPLHAIFVYGIDFIPAFSGNYYAHFAVVLTDSVLYEYFSPVPMTFLQANTLLNSILNFQVSGYPGDWKGEGFNFIMRQLLTDKTTGVGTTNWLLSH